MDEKPWHVVAREYTGWLSYALWPYRAYKWATATKASTLAVPKPQKQAAIRQVKITEWHGFEGSGAVAFLWFLGLFIPIFSYKAWEETSNPDTFSLMLTSVPLGAAIFIAGVMYYIKHSRTSRWEDAPLGANELPTPHHTKLANEHLRVALANYKEMFGLRENHLQLGKLGMASHHLAKSRSYDPGATVIDKEPPEKGPPITYTQDELASLMLFLESDLYFKQADAAFSNSMDAFDSSYESKLKRKRYSQEEQETLKSALTAIDKALRYQPNNTRFLCHQAKIYNGLKEPKKAKTAIQKAYDIDPDDIEILKMKTAR